MTFDGISFYIISQLKRNDREIENLFNSVQNTIEAKETSVEKCYMLSESNLPILKIKLDETSTLCENVLNRGVNEEAVSQDSFSLCIVFTTFYFKKSHQIEQIFHLVDKMLLYISGKTFARKSSRERKALGSFC